MKKYLFLTAAILFTTGQQVLCAVEEVSPELQHSLKTTSHEPNFLSVITALLFVIALIYITGVIYSKLNLAGAKTVQKQIRDHNLSKAVVISTTQLGQGKNLHVIELNKKHYLIGATTSSITLIKELGEKVYDEKDIKPQTNEKEQAEEDKAKTAEVDVDKAIRALYGSEYEAGEEPEEKFELHKKYL